MSKQFLVMTLNIHEPRITREEAGALTTAQLMARYYDPKEPSNQHIKVEMKEAKTEADLCWDMVVNSYNFPLEEILNEFVSKETSSIQSHRIFMKEMFKGVDPVTVALEDPKTWLTPQMAERMWKIYNDPRMLTSPPINPVVRNLDEETHLGYNSSVPGRSLTISHIVPLESVCCSAWTENKKRKSAK